MEGHLQQEAHLRQILKIEIALVLGVLSGIFVSVVASPTQTATLAETDLMANGLRVRVPNQGLQVRVPNGMKNFPVELIALP
jgi:hypothetical protein